MNKNLTEREVIDGLSELQQIVQSQLDSGTKSIAMVSLNSNLKRALMIANQLTSDKPAGETNKPARGWKKSNAAAKPANQLTSDKPADVAKQNDAYLASLGNKKVEDFKKLNKTALLAIVKTINDKEQDEAKKLNPTETATKDDIANLLYDYLNPPAGE